MTDHAPGLERLFPEAAPEGVWSLATSAGELPEWLRGTWLANGPGRFARSGQRLEHWLDGDGLLSTVSFDGSGGARLTQRFVATRKRSDEESAGRFLYRTFGTRFAEDRLLHGVGLASPANVSVYPFRGELVAFGEQGLPWSIDPQTLATRGEQTFDRALNAASPFSAHPCFDPTSGEMWSFGISFAASRPTLNLYRFGAVGGDDRFRLPLPYPCSIHDFGLSPRFAIFYLNPYLLDMGTMLGGGTVMDALAWRPELGSRLLLVERASGEVAAEVPLDGRYCLHQINAFEAGDRLVIDLLELDTPVYDQYRPIPELFTSVSAGRPRRLVVDLVRHEIAETIEVAYERAPDFAAHDPHEALSPSRHFWMLGIAATGQPGRKFFDEIVHGNWEQPDRVDLWRAPAGHYLGAEPVFVRAPGGGDAGIVLCQLFDAATPSASLVLFDAFDLPRGPLARLPLPTGTPPQFHTTFVPR